MNEAPWPDSQTPDLAVAACYDGHSNETVWPWYSNIAPVSWLVSHDVEEGRHHLNFSNGGSSQYAVHDIPEVVSSGEMPPFYYAMMHPNTKLTDSERQALIDGISVMINPTP